MEYKVQNLQLWISYLQGDAGNLKRVQEIASVIIRYLILSKNLYSKALQNKYILITIDLQLICYIAPLHH